MESKGSAAALLDKGPEKSPTKARQPRKVDLRARYWAFLFDNLRRAVDEIYVTCESDQSVVECRVSALQWSELTRQELPCSGGGDRSDVRALEGDIAGLTEFPGAVAHIPLHSCFLSAGLSEGSLVRELSQGSLVGPTGLNIADRL